MVLNIVRLDQFPRPTIPIVQYTVNSPTKTIKIPSKFHQNLTAPINSCGGRKIHYIVACVCAVCKTRRIDGNGIVQTRDFLLRTKRSPKTARRARRMKQIGSPMNCQSPARKTNHRKILTTSHWYVSETIRLQVLLLIIAALPFATGISTDLEGSSRPRARRSQVRLSSSSTCWTL